jgi:predicted Zn-dependent protease
MKPLLITFFGLLVLTSCSTVPLTGRRQLNLLSDNQVNSLALTQYQQFISANPVVEATSPEAERVTRIGNRLASAITKYLSGKGLSDRIAGYNWEFKLVQSKQINAWCMPGGKVVVYTGILPLCQDDNGLATVMGHEIAHAIARHGNERMSRALVEQGIETAADVALSNTSTNINIFNSAFGVATSVGSELPHSRLQESEADHLGLIFMALAGYDPKAALAFWGRMANLSKQEGSIFLSDHPSDATRIADIQKLLPEANQYYQMAQKR